MALITTTFTPDAITQPFTIFPEPITRFSAMPRAEVHYDIIGGSVTLSGVGDQQAIEVLCFLPVNFAYAIVDLFMDLCIAGTAANTWDRSARCSFNNANVGRTISVIFPAQAAEDSNTVNSQCLQWVPSTLPKIVQAAPPGINDPFLHVGIENSELNKGAGTFNFFARFLQYDIEQWHHAEVNDAKLIR